jgi:UDP-N-acetylmuramate dehydrogenase
MDYSAFYSKLKLKFPNYQIFQNHPLAPYTTLKIGGPADIFIDTPTIDQFTSILNFVYESKAIIGEVNNFSAHSERSPTNVGEPEGSAHCKNSLMSQLPLTILGNGSNVLISDQGIRGLVIRHLNPLRTIIQQALDQNLVGLENFAYIPASLGGAIVSNIHGFDKTNFNEYLDTITVFNLKTGQTENLKASKLSWGYDQSEFQSRPHLIILSATFNLKSGDGISAKLKYDDIVKTKTQTQPFNSAGCVFKNPPATTAKLSAGQIIDSLGWKSKSVGGAQVSPLHANFIVNTGSATASDFYTLTTSIQSDVLAKTGIHLDFEIKLLGQF